MQENLIISVNCFMVSEQLTTSIQMAGTTSSASSSPSLVTFSSSNPTISIKLDRSNYLLWRSQFLPFLRCHQLVGYVDGTLPCPPQFLLDSTKKSTTTVNLDYLHSQRQDQLLLGWLMSILSESVLAQCFGRTSLRSLWSTLEHLFASQSRARVMQLRFQLQTLKKGSLSMADYIQKCMSIADNLSMIGQPISDDNLSLYILGGLAS